MRGCAEQRLITQRMSEENGPDATECHYYVLPPPSRDTIWNMEMKEAWGD